MRVSSAALAASILIFALPVRAQLSAQDLLLEMERVEAVWADGDTGLSRMQNDPLKPFAAHFKKIGQEAVPDLAQYIAQRERPRRVRLYAAAFLGMIRDPLAYPALKKRVLDKREDAGLRAASLQSIGALKLKKGDAILLLESAAFDDNPQALVTEALAQMSWIGSLRVNDLVRVAKQYGHEPRGLALGTVEHAIQSIERSRNVLADQALLSMIRFYRGKSPLRARVLSALLRRRQLAAQATARTRNRLKRRDFQAIVDSVISGQNNEAMIAARLLGVLEDKRATPPLSRALKTVTSPELLAEIAHTLAAIGDARAATPLRKIADGLISDPRFEATPGVEARRLASRIERSADFFSSQKKTEIPRQILAEVARTSALDFRYQGWPGEGRPRLAANGSVSRLKLKEKPDTEAPISANWNVARGEPLRFEDSLVITRSPGRAIARNETEIDVRVLGRVDTITRKLYEQPALQKKIPLRSGQPFEILAYHAAGLCFLRIEGEVYESECPQNDVERFQSFEDPLTDWWLELVRDGQRGWIHSDIAGVDFLSREL